MQSARVSMQDGEPILLEAEDALQRSLQSMRLVDTWPAHDADVFSVAVSPDGTRLATIGADATAKVWESSTGRLLHVFPTHVTRDFTGVGVAFTPDGRRLLTLGGDKVAVLWDLSTGRRS
jgi:WD40 repeat protein